MPATISRPCAAAAASHSSWSCVCFDGFIVCPCVCRKLMKSKLVAYHAGKALLPFKTSHTHTHTSLTCTSSAPVSSCTKLDSSFIPASCSTFSNGELFAFCVCCCFTEPTIKGAPRPPAVFLLLPSGLLSTKPFAGVDEGMGDLGGGAERGPAEASRSPCVCKCVCVCGVM